jgi:hypothetical protein
MVFPFNETCAADGRGRPSLPMKVDVLELLFGRDGPPARPYVHERANGKDHATNLNPGLTLPPDYCIPHGQEKERITHAQSL